MKVKQWLFAMDWLREKGLPPANPDYWAMAIEEYEKQQKEKNNG